MAAAGISSRYTEMSDALHLSPRAVAVRRCIYFTGAERGGRQADDVFMVKATHDVDNAVDIGLAMAIAGFYERPDQSELASAGGYIYVNQTYSRHSPKFLCAASTS